MSPRNLAAIARLAASRLRPSRMLRVPFNFAIHRVSTGVVVAVLGAMGIVVEGHAEPLTLRFDNLSESAPITVSDGGADDESAASGAIAYSKPHGEITVNETSGFSYPVLGSPVVPHMQFKSFQIRTNPDIVGGGSGREYSLFLSHTDFVTNGPTELVATISGFVDSDRSGGDIIGYAAFLGTDNQLFSLDVPLASLDLRTPDVSSAVESILVDVTGPYSLTLWMTIDFGNSGVASFDVSLQAVPVPEPSSLGLLGLALVGLGFSRRKRAVN